MDLRQLIEKYELANPRRASGGVNALAGFDFQIRVYLADFIESYAKGRDLNEIGTSLAAGLEALSDYSSSDPDVLTLVQVKRTITKSSLASAANEFSEIESFIRCDSSIALTPKFRVVGCQTSMESSPDWCDIALPPKTQREKPELLPIWDSIKLERRLDPVEITSDPWWRTIVAACRCLDNPFEFARSALEIVLRRGELEATQIRDRLVELVKQHEANQPPNYHALGLEDFQENESVRLHELMVGTRPSLALQRDRQFMVRSELVREACRLMEGAENSEGNFHFNQIPVFWISGRSGCGKSVVLLQVMESLVRKNRRVVWLDDDSTSLSDLLVSIQPSAQLTSDELPEFVFVDDLYSPKGQSGLKLDEIRRLVSAAPAHPWPTIVTCGPPEFLSQLHQAGTTDFLNIQDWVLPPVGEKEKSEFYNWFEERTGETPKTGEAFAQSEGLMISMAFEVVHGDLAAFSARFKERLRSSGLEESLCVPLAVNRLYILAPSDWLKEPEWERLDALNQDSDFSILDIESQGKYLRLTHPHLSDSIYRTVRSPASARAYANDLAEAISRAKHDLFTLRQLMGALATGHERLNAVDMAHLVDSFARDWNRGRFLERGEARSDILVSIACWDARCCDLKIGEKLQEPLLDEARKALDDSPALWPHLWQRLHQSFPDNSALIDDARKWLSSSDAKENSAYSRVWETLWDTCQDQHYTFREEVSKAGIEWLNARRYRNDWHFVWKKLLSSNQLCTSAPIHQLLETGWAQLKDDQIAQTLTWPYIWGDLANSIGDSSVLDRDELLKSGVNWIDGREGHKSWEFVWQKLIDQPNLPEDIDRNELLVDGFNWLTDREDNPSWSFVWRELVDQPKLPVKIDRNELLESGFNWLIDREENLSWSYVCCRLLEQTTLPESIDRKDISMRGFSWLMESKKTDYWQFVWRVLMTQSELPESIDRDELLVHAFAWLTDHEDSDSWSLVWRELIRQSTLPVKIDRDELLARGFHWLTDREENYSWPYVWVDLKVQQILPTSIDHDELMERGFSWLADYQDHEFWGVAWQNLAKDAARPESIPIDAVYDVGLKWLSNENNLSRGEWDKLFETLLEAERVNEELLKAGASWARKNLELPQTPPLIAKIIRYSKDLNSVDDLAISLVKILDGHPTRASSKFCFAYLGKDPRFKNLADRPYGISKLVAWLKPTANSYSPATLQLAEKLKVRGNPVSGMITKKIQAGFLVVLKDLDVESFLHESQVEVVKPTDWELYLNREFQFLLEKVDASEIRVSRKAFLTQQAILTLSVNQKVTGIVTNIVDYGAFIRAGEAIGLLHRTKYLSGDTHWPPPGLKVGNEIKVVVNRIDHQKPAVYFSLLDAIKSA